MALNVLVLHVLVAKRAQIEIKDKARAASEPNYTVTWYPISHDRLLRAKLTSSRNGLLVCMRLRLWFRVARHI